ncbi:hypothetical protein THICB1_110019 [Thiomonas arsenitoxydans]|uniref:Uncharacterized protein n=1 Tax=Thiomonas arsenitoxydans (strain DSM 22701 / CIP 110005 / 3As) TaxID=426114 RepID=A0ABM9T164_THIA3|nr:hypothetical protein THICB1_110019 [Thiomonas arsenitoxydans]CQR29340.1 hypothetical protein THICB6_150086 [Thiomonas arsenitoxydans]CQR41073.1 hypothetical protein ACO3_70056 [Thiomonas arsenitoxydans]CQR41171.1 hypothetical protein ACO7_70056 [Thiomonas arsenitoxydans]
MSKNQENILLSVIELAIIEAASTIQRVSQCGVHTHLESTTAVASAMRSCWSSWLSGG